MRSSVVRISKHLLQLPTHLADRAHWTAIRGWLCLHIGGQLQQSHPWIVFWDHLYTFRQAVAIMCDFPKNAVQRAVEGTWHALYQWCGLSVIRGLGSFSFYNLAVVNSIFEGKSAFSGPRKKLIQNFGGAGRSGSIINFRARRSRLVVSGILQFFYR